LQRVGSDREHRADVRVIAATNRDLAEEVRAGRFRADLYHRLGVFPLSVPALRERAGDVLLLAGGFIEENRRRMGLRGLRLAPGAQQALLAYPWPGNVRELEYLIARATLRARARLSLVAEQTAQPIVTLETVDLDLASTAHSPTAAAVGAVAERPANGDLRTQVDAFQRQRIEATLHDCAGNTAAAARALGLDRGNLVRLAQRLGLSLNRRKTGATTQGEQP
jgi:anaerobic nitric oxide reductase transcription regulator